MTMCVCHVAGHMTTQQHFFSAGSFCMGDFGTLVVALPLSSVGEETGAGVGDSGMVESLIMIGWLTGLRILFGLVKSLQFASVSRVLSLFFFAVEASPVAVESSSVCDVSDSALSGSCMQANQDRSGVDPGKERGLPFAREVFFPQA